ncbi:hypothetical protein CYMTET_29717 [Cymbomonas tetramitiformis]|uniref:Alpha-1,3-glucosyltransferase n=1 Tax=Cymbomonas tetramitiformis TaxID=36881 RepID=A0AAE0FKQ0_9CHLO|nr:hypothetical protein CYMTET_29717 [Cymbomonas tetramitiformis]
MRSTKGLSDLLAESGALTPLIVGVAVLVRLCVALHPYSGEGTPPMYGDYEAQRHWMEITLHTPVQEWYFNTSSNDLQYWGLDYPPLTAYQSLLHGALIDAIEPEAVALGTSHGYSPPTRLARTLSQSNWRPKTTPPRQQE